MSITTKGTTDMNETFFTKLYSVSYNNETKQKMGLSYLPWSRAYAEMMKVDPFFEWGVYQYTPIDNVNDEAVHYSEPRDYWIQNGTCMVKTWISVHKSALVDGYDGDEMIKKNCFLPIMNQRNAPIKSEEVTTMDVNKAIWRCFVKNVALFGIGLHVYNGEEFSDEDAEIKKLQTACYELIGKKCKLGAPQKEQVTKICKEAIPDGNGDPNLCDDKETLSDLKKKLLSIR